MLRSPLNRIAAHPVWVQTLIFLALALVALFMFGLLALLSPFVMILAGIALIVAVFVLVVRFLRRRPLKMGPRRANVPRALVGVHGDLQRPLFQRTTRTGRLAKAG